MMVKKCLIVVPGISKVGNYMNLDEAGVELDYDQVIYFDTDKTFDNYLFNLFTDKWDFIPYFTKKKMRQEVCTRLNNLINMNRRRYERVDVLSHSLGTIIALECGKRDSSVAVDKLVCLQSPLNNSWYGWYVKNHVKKYHYNLTAKEVYFTYNKKDWKVANSHKDFSYLRGICSVIAEYTCGIGHDWAAAFKEFLGIYKRVFNANF
jgi:hypothetical protein